MKRILLAIFVICFQIKSNAQQQLFNEGWRFHKGDIPAAEKDHSDTASWRLVSLPHDWSIEGPFSDAWASATGYLPGGIGWYKKSFVTPRSWQSKNIFIYFDGVYKNSTVWLNGHLLGNRPNGFIPFEYELTKYLNKSGENVLSVKVDHSEFADARWYTGSGIYRNVYLSVKDPVHITTWGLQFFTKDVSSTSATAHTKVSMVNTGKKSRLITVECKLQDSKGNIVARERKKINIGTIDTTVAGFTFQINRPQLWAVDRPALYQLSATLLEDDKTVDSYTEQTGIRSIRIDADSGFFLNGQNMKLKGVCIHDDAGALGVAVPEGVWRTRLQTLKALGCNSIRMSHNPHVDYLYSLCDEMGFLVLDEAFDEWETGKNKWIKGWNVGTPGKDGYHKYFKEWANRDVRDMVLRNFNRPSIIAWSIGNEVDYPNDPYSHEVLNTGNNPQIYGKGYLPDHPPASRLGELSKQLVDVVKQYDTTRPVTAALAGVVMSNTTTYPGNLDWVGYNYQEYRYKEDHETYPKRIIHGSENGKQLKAWDAVDSNAYISAQYLWTGIDYLGEAGRWPQRSNGAGLIDLAGFPKPEYYFRQSLWTTTPMIYIGATKISRENNGGNRRSMNAQPTWRWTEGDSIRVSCFTNCTSAELFLNGKSLGKRSMSALPNRVILWDVAYQPGELKVVGYNKDIEAAQSRLQTAGNPKTLQAEVIKDPKENTGLVQLIIRVVDENGILVHDAENEIELSVEGTVLLLGLESGSTSSHEDYKGNKRKAKNGKLMAYLQREKVAVGSTITIRSQQLSPITIKL